MTVMDLVWLIKLKLPQKDNLSKLIKIILNIVFFKQMEYGLFKRSRDAALCYMWISIVFHFYRRYITNYTKVQYKIILKYTLFGKNVNAKRDSRDSTRKTSERKVTEELHHFDAILVIFSALLMKMYVYNVILHCKKGLRRPLLTVAVLKALEGICLQFSITYS